MTREDVTEMILQLLLPTLDSTRIILDSIIIRLYIVRTLCNILQYRSEQKGLVCFDLVSE